MKQKIIAILGSAFMTFIIITMIIMLAGCSKLFESADKAATVVAKKVESPPSPPPPTAQQKADRARRKIDAKATFLKLCDGNGGIKEFDDNYYVARYTHVPKIVCNNGLTSTFQFENDDSN